MTVSLKMKINQISAHFSNCKTSIYYCIANNLKNFSISLIIFKSKLETLSSASFMMMTYQFKLEIYSKREGPFIYYLISSNANTC